MPGLLITFLFLALTSACKPFCTEGLSRLHALTLVAQFISLYGGLVLIVEDYIKQQLAAANQSDNTNDKTAIIYALVYLCNGAVVAWPAIQFLLLKSPAEYAESIRSYIKKKAGGRDQDPADGGGAEASAQDNAIPLAGGLPRAPETAAEAEADSGPQLEPVLQQGGSPTSRGHDGSGDVVLAGAGVGVRGLLPQAATAEADAGSEELAAGVAVGRWAVQPPSQAASMKAELAFVSSLGGSDDSRVLASGSCPPARPDADIVPKAAAPALDEPVVERNAPTQEEAATRNSAAPAPAPLEIVTVIRAEAAAVRQDPLQAAPAAPVPAGRFGAVGSPADTAAGDSGPSSAHSESASLPQAPPVATARSADGASATAPTGVPCGPPLPAANEAESPRPTPSAARWPSRPPAPAAVASAGKLHLGLPAPAAGDPNPAPAAVVSAGEPQAVQVDLQASAATLHGLDADAAGLRPATTAGATALEQSGPTAGPEAAGQPREAP